MESNYFCIGGHNICLQFSDTKANSMELLPSFVTFCLEDCPQNLLFTLTVDDSLRPMKERKLVRKFDTGNGDTVVYQLPDGGYQYIIRDIHNRDCCLLICNKDFSQNQCALNGDWVMRSFGLNDALMLIYAFAGSFHQTLLIHASCILLRPQEPGEEAVAYPFTAKSGTGKSTHSSLWMKHIEGAELLNDDNPIIRLIDGKPYIFGSPWSGKTPCYRNVQARLGAVTLIDRAPRNSIERLGPVQAFATLLPACSSMKWDGPIYNSLCDCLTHIIETTPVYTLHCLPDEEAAVLCHHTITQ
ncbi:MAG: hypothetical protein J6Z14_12850 [Prevotella sp.]|nr:hypothetical protein [Prevotella sp.]